MKVGLVACKMTKQEKKKETSREKMIFDLVKSLYDENNISRDDIDTVVMSSNDFYDGRTISNCFTVDPASAFHKDETKVEEDGLFALAYGVMRILTGVHKTALVVAHSMASQSNLYIAQKSAFSPLYERVTPWLNEISIAAFQANAYMNKYKVSDETLAKVSVKNLRNASKNPYAFRALSGLTVEDVLDSEPYYLPLRELSCYPLTDGAAAVILAEESLAKKMSENPVWLTGMGYSNDTYYFSERPLSRIDSISDAASQAYKMAGIKNPQEDLDLAEISEFFAHQEMMACESLGLCSEGEAKKLLEEGTTEIEGKIPVNASGGCLAANALCASGLVRAIEAAIQIKGEAGEHQVKKGIKNAVAHGQTGLCAQSNIVMVLSS